MVSLKRHLDLNEERIALLRVISLLMNGIATRAVQGDRVEYEAFQKTMQRIQASAGGEASADELLVAAGSALQALDEFSQRTTQTIRKQGIELQNIISMLTRTVITISAGSDRSSERLQEISQQLARAVQLEDVQQLKVQLDDCLGHLREECLRQKQETEKIVTALQSEIKNSEERDSANEPLDLDPITGLPSQETAEATFQDLVRKPGKRFVVVAVVNRMQPINARFGHSVGNQVLRTFKEFFQHELGSQDRLFRWSGPALVAVLERTEALEIVRAEVRRMLNKPLENTTFDVGGREVLIPVSASWSVFTLIPPVTTANRQIQAFIASQGVRDYA